MKAAEQALSYQLRAAGLYQWAREAVDNIVAADVLTHNAQVRQALRLQRAAAEAAALAMSWAGLARER